jgi:hypothetical protein
LLEARSTSRIVQSSVSVKFWQSHLPSVDALRPDRCVACGVAARNITGKLVIHGHGLRSRVVLGPPGGGEVPEVAEIKARRYRCLLCRAIMLVVPGGVLRRCLFLATAIALALGRWAEGLPAPAVRREVSPQRRPGPTAAAGWASLRRWARTAPRLWPRSPPLARQGPWRATALAVVAFLASFAPVPTGRVTEDAVVGATHLRGWPPRPGGDSGASHHP